MVAFDRERVLLNVRKSTTEDLLDRVTAYRAGMEPEAIDLIEAELLQRGVGAEQIKSHTRRCQQETLQLADGTAVKCSFCRRPAVVRLWGWHRLWGLLPIFPRQMRYCAKHRHE
jgi:hypothetical protein